MVLDDEEIHRESAFDKERLVWRLLRLLPALIKDDLFAPLKQYLADALNLNLSPRLRHGKTFQIELSGFSPATV